MDLNVNRAFLCLVESVCEKLVGGLRLTSSGLLTRQIFRGMWETSCGWATHKHAHTHTPIHSLLGQGEEC